MPKSQIYCFFLRSRTYKFLFLFFVAMFAAYPILDAYSDSFNPALLAINDIDDDHDDDQGDGHGSFHAAKHASPSFHVLNYAVFWSSPINTTIPLLYSIACDAGEWRIKYAVIRFTLMGRASPQHAGITRISSHGPPSLKSCIILQLQTQVAQSYQGCRPLSSDPSPPIL